MTWSKACPWLPGDSCYGRRKCLGLPFALQLTESMHAKVPERLPAAAESQSNWDSQQTQVSLGRNNVRFGQHSTSKLQLRQIRACYDIWMWRTWNKTMFHSMELQPAKCLDQRTVASKAPIFNSKRLEPINLLSKFPLGTQAMAISLAALLHLILLGSWKSPETSAAGIKFGRILEKGRTLFSLAQKAQGSSPTC